MEDGKLYHIVVEDVYETQSFDSNMDDERVTKFRVLETDKVYTLREWINEDDS